MFGAAFDASCQLWQDSCGDRGSCFHYDSELLAQLIFTICFTLKIASVISMFLAWWLYKPPNTEPMLECEIKAEPESDNKEKRVSDNQDKADETKRDAEREKTPDRESAFPPNSVVWSVSDESVHDFLEGTHVDELTFNDLHGHREAWGSSAELTASTNL